MSIKGNFKVSDPENSHTIPTTPKIAKNSLAKHSKPSELLSQNGAEITVDSNKESVPPWVREYVRSDLTDLGSGSLKNWTDGMGNTLLHLCCARRQTEHVRQAIELGFDPNCKNAYGWTPLCITAAHGYQIGVSYLLTLPNVSVSLENAFGFTPLMLSIASGHFKTTELLLGHSGATKHSSSGLTALMLASFRGCTKTVSILLQKGAECNQQYALNGWTALMFAICCDAVDEGIDQDGDDFSEERALDSSTCTTNTPLYNQLPANSSSHGDGGIGTSGNGSTPKTSPPQLLNVIRQLIASGADVLVKNWIGKSAVDIAFDSEKWDIVHLLVKSLDSQRLKYVDAQQVYRTRYQGNACVQPILQILQEPAMSGQAIIGEASIHSETPRLADATVHVDSSEPTASENRAKMTPAPSLPPNPSSSDRAGSGKPTAEAVQFRKVAQSTPASKESDALGSSNSLAQSKRSLKGWIEKIAGKIGIASGDYKPTFERQRLSDGDGVDPNDASCDLKGSQRLSTGACQQTKSQKDEQVDSMGNANVSNKSSYSLGSSTLSNIYSLPLEGSFNGGKFPVAKRLHNSTSSAMAHLLVMKPAASNGNSLNVSANLNARSRDSTPQDSTPKQNLLQALEEENSSTSYLKGIVEFAFICLQPELALHTPLAIEVALSTTCARLLTPHPSLQQRH